MDSSDFLGGFFLIMVIMSFAGWIQHLYTCIIEATYVLLVAGAIFAPIGTLHGWGIWMGIF